MLFKKEFNGDLYVPQTKMEKKNKVTNESGRRGRRRRQDTREGKECATSLNAHYVLELEKKYVQVHYLSFAKMKEDRSEGPRNKVIK